MEEQPVQHDAQDLRIRLRRGGAAAQEAGLEEPEAKVRKKNSVFEMRQAGFMQHDRG